MNGRERAEFRERERIRNQTRAEYSRKRDAERERQARFKQAEKSDLKKRRRYVARHGRFGAFVRTLLKWVIGGLVVSVALTFLTTNGPSDAEVLSGAADLYVLIVVFGFFRSVKVMFTSFD